MEPDRIGVNLGSAVAGYVTSRKRLNLSVAVIPYSKMGVILPTQQDYGEI